MEGSAVLKSDLIAEDRWRELVTLSAVFNAVSSHYLRHFRLMLSAIRLLLAVETADLP